MDWFSPFVAKPRPRPCKLPLNTDERVDLYRLRADRGEPIFVQGDSMDARDADRIGWAGSDRNSNGSDTSPEIAREDWDEDAPDELPDGWLADELAEFRARQPAQETHREAA